MSSVKCLDLAIPDVKLIEPVRHCDARGVFCEVWHRDDFHNLGVAYEFVQDNLAASTKRQTVRGLHMQVGSHSQGKLVRVVRGSIWDVAVDVRAGSPTFGQHASIELSASNWFQLWIPPGFLHGYCTLEDETEVLYKATKPYKPQAELGVHWRDSTLNIPWPFGGHEVSISDRDANLPSFAEVKPILLRPK
jgi:dTDP-4-dehydrorhamnose 3,5-epimerase